VSEVSREFGVSRKTAYKWLSRYRADPLAVLSDRSRRPLRSPGKTVESVEHSVLAVRDEFGWGGRIIRRILCNQDASAQGAVIPASRTISRILHRCGRSRSRAKPAEQTFQPFERPAPNDLWQLDHMGPREIARQRYHPFTITDDHSRFCLCFEPLRGTGIDLYWPVLWEAFATYGLPGAILCDNAFSAWGLGLSEFDHRLIRLGIRPVHGRPYHPQTQGKVERLHATISRELFGFKARTGEMQTFLEDRDCWQRTYNYVRPHESLGDCPPISRFRNSERKRPDHLPPMEYPAGAVLRKVSQVGDIHFKRVRIAVARCLHGQYVRIEETEHQIAVFYGPRQLRTLGRDQLTGKTHNQRT
jgi:transposase InsO family protein